MSAGSSHFPWSDDELDRRVRQAVKTMWATRESQTQKQIASGKRDAGTRGSATGGKHLDPFCELLMQLARAAGFAPAEIRYTRGTELPGFYRASKQWDLVVVRGGRLCAAIELKSMSGSYGKNLNNRSEEALGSAVDIWAAFKKGTLGLHQPWLGYLFVIREEDGSSSSVRVPLTPLRTDPEFEGASYIERYGILCERMVLERVYTSAAFIASPLGTKGDYTEPRRGLGFAQFARGFFGHLVGCTLEPGS